MRPIAPFTTACTTRASSPAAARKDTERMSARRSSESATSSGRSTMNSLKLRTSPPLDIAGALPQRIPRELGKFGRILGASLTVKLLGLVGIFIALPIILYGQFEQVDRQTRSVVTASMQHQNWLVAQALTPMLDRPERPPHRSLNGELARFAAPGTRLSLLFNPTGGDARAFYYVASTVVASALEPTTEPGSLNPNRLLPRP